MTVTPRMVERHFGAAAIIACPPSNESASSAAITDQQGSYSWSELLAAADQCAAQLRRLGPSGRVAIACGRSFSYAAAFVGAIAANWTAVPVEWSGSPATGEIEPDILAVITDHDDQEIVGKIHPAEVALLRWTDVLPLIAGSTASGELAIAGGYSMPTSGTTGRPKRVNISGASLRSSLRRFASRAGLRAADRYLHVAAWDFSSSVRQLLAPLAAGACVVVACDADRQDPARLIELMQREGVTVLDGSPSLLRNIAFAVNSGLVPDPFVKTLRLVICASEMLNARDVEQFRQALGFTGSFEYFYGLTETAGLVGCAPGNDQMEQSEAFNCEMAALPECDIRVLDEQLNVVPDGVLGEIAVLTASPDVYYEGDPRATAQLAVPCPWCASGRMIMTGDLAVQVDGKFRIVGRRDDVVKVRGQRVSLADLAAVARGAPGIADAAAVLVDSEIGCDIALFIATQPGTEAVRRVREQLRHTVRGAAYPRYVTALPEIPRTGSGKPDLAALRALADSIVLPTPTGVS